jgi:hypothetical protein
MPVIIRDYQEIAESAAVNVLECIEDDYNVQAAIDRMAALECGQVGPSSDEPTDPWFVARNAATAALLIAAAKSLFK